jgi:hypothetical protein
MRKDKVKAHLSDEDDIVDDSNTTSAIAHSGPNKEEAERRELELAPVIGDSEISPAAYLFQNQEEHDEVNLFE